jgi:hypothetical protein
VTKTFKKNQQMKKNTIIAALACTCLVSLSLNFMAFRNPDSAGIKKSVTSNGPSGEECSFRGLSLTQVVQMVRQYGRYQTPAINTSLASIFTARSAGGYSFVDARSIHFKLDTLANFICAVRTQVLNQKIFDQAGVRITPAETGIRIYYSAYPLDPANKIVLAGALSRSYKGRHTLVFVATYWDSKLKQYVDFDPNPYGISPSGVPYQLNSNSYNSSQPGMFFSPVVTENTDPSGSREVDGRNHGELCPPPTPCPSVILNMAGY